MSIAIRHRRRTHVPRARTTDKRYYGVVEAIVVENTGDPKKEGRVKIQFPWFDDKMVTEWCRVRKSYAGKGYGAFFVPETGDEVLVAFVHGDMRLPVIMGGLYNGKDKPPSDRTKEKDQKMIRTKAGHELLFDDSSKERRIKLTSVANHVFDLNDQDENALLETKGKHRLFLDDKGKKVTLKTKNGNTVEMDDDASKVTVKTSKGQTITLDGNSGMITIEATNVQVKATNVAIQSGHVELCSGASEPVILGTSWITYFSTHVHTSNIPGLPTSPPLVPPTPNVLSTKIMAG